MAQSLWRQWLQAVLIVLPALSNVPMLPVYVGLAWISYAQRSPGRSRGRWTTPTALLWLWSEEATAWYHLHKNSPHPCHLRTQVFLADPIRAPPSSHILRVGCSYADSQSARKSLNVRPSLGQAAISPDATLPFWDPECLELNKENCTLFQTLFSQVLSPSDQDISVP